MSFDMRVKSGSLAGHINVVDIVITAPQAIPENQPPTARAGSDATIMLPVDSVKLNGLTSSDPEAALLNMLGGRYPDPLRLTSARAEFRIRSCATWKPVSIPLN